MEVPSVFADGFETARRMDPALAHLYMSHMRIGDAVADAAVAGLSGLPPAEARRFLRGAMELQEDVVSEAPQGLQRLVEQVSALPAWYERESAQHGCRAFLRNSDALLAAYICGSTVEVFSTMLGKSYALTGRLLGDTVRRVKLHVQQLLEMFLPRGIEPGGEGWKLTLRIRLAHAGARLRLQAAGEWEHDAWGVPVSAAHLSLGAAACSARLLEFAPPLGVELDRNEREGIVAVWRCAAHVAGVPQALQFRNREEGLRLFRVAAACEPPPDLDAMTIANYVANSVPAVIGISGFESRADLAKYVYRVSRELIGDEAADRLGFPTKEALPLLPWLRARGRVTRGLLRFFPKTSKARDREAFMRLLRISDLGEEEFDYALPDHVRAAASKRG